jgi:hypothetical protein
MGRTHVYLPHASVSRPVETRHKTLINTDFAFRFFAVYIQRQLIFTRLLLFIVYVYMSSLTAHHQVYKLF